MDTQLTQLKRCNKNKHEIVYPHNGELIIYRKERDDNGIITFVEIRVNTETKVTVKRKMRTDEMTEAQFDMIKPILDEETRTSFNQDWLETYQNVCFDVLEETDLACVPSPETEMIEAFDTSIKEAEEAAKPFHRTIECAEEIMSSCLTPTQKKRFLLVNVDGLSSRQIAEKDKVSHTAVNLSIKTAKTKIKKKLEKLSREGEKHLSKTPEKSI